MGVVFHSCTTDPLPGPGFVPILFGGRITEYICCVRRIRVS